MHRARRVESSRELIAAIRAAAAAAVATVNQLSAARRSAWVYKASLRYAARAAEPRHRTGSIERSLCRAPQLNLL